MGTLAIAWLSASAGVFVGFLLAAMFRAGE